MSKRRGDARKSVSAPDITFHPGNPRLERMLAKPGMAEAVAEQRARMRDADEHYALGLAALRRAAALTQVEVAERLGITQAAVAKTEQREDLLLSTLSSYLKALGGHGRVVVEFDDGREIDVDLAALGHRSIT